MKWLNRTWNILQILEKMLFNSRHAGLNWFCFHLIFYSLCWFNLFNKWILIFHTNMFHVSERNIWSEEEMKGRRSDWSLLCRSSGVFMIRTEEFPKWTWTPPPTCLTHTHTHTHTWVYGCHSSPASVSMTASLMIELLQKQSWSIWDLIQTSDVSISSSAGQSAGETHH